MHGHNTSACTCTCTCMRPNIPKAVLSSAHTHLEPTALCCFKHALSLWLDLSQHARLARGRVCRHRCRCCCCMLCRAVLATLIGRLGPKEAGETHVWCCCSEGLAACLVLKPAGVGHSTQDRDTGRKGTAGHSGGGNRVSHLSVTKLTSTVTKQRVLLYTNTKGTYCSAADRHPLKSRQGS